MVLLAGLLVLVLISGTGTPRAALPSATPLASVAPATVSFLFDLGDGTYAWANELIPNPSAMNATWDAMLAAAQSSGLHVSWSWSSQFAEAFILDIGNRSPPAGAVAIFVWNRTASAWAPAPVGLNQLVLADGSAVALSDNGFNPVTYDYLYPVPTPEHPYPTLDFRSDASNTGRSPSPSPDGFRLLWDRNLSLQEIPSSPVVAYGRVYILTLDGLFALNEANGSLVWSNPGIKGLSTAAVFNGTLILGATDGKLHAIDAATGAERWNTPLVAHPVFSGITSSPKVVFDTVYVGAFNETGGPGEVVALWATNGTVIWRHPTASIDFSSPAVANGTVYVGVMGRYNTTTQITFDPPYGVLALDAATGAQRWFYATNGSVAASPLLTGNKVIAPSKDGNVYALDQATGHLLWLAPANATASSPTLDNGSLYIPGANGVQGMVTTLAVDTGGFRALRGTAGAPTSLTYSQGKLLLATNDADGWIYCWWTGSLGDVWYFIPSPSQYILSTPVAADGMVFGASDNGHVYAFAEPPSMVNVTVSATANVTSGQDGQVVVTGSAAGALDHLWVNFTSPSLTVVSASPTGYPSAGARGWDLGPQFFNSGIFFTLTVRATCADSCPGGIANFTVRITTQATNGTVVSLPPRYGSIHVLAAAPVPLPFEVVAAIVVAVVAVVGIAVYLLLRRKPRAP